MLPAGAGAPGPEIPIAGLTVQRRIELAARRAGLHLGPPPPVAPGSAWRIVILAANVIPQPAWLRELRDLPFQAGRLAVDGAEVAVIDVKTPEAVLDVLARSGSVAEATAALRGVLEPAPLAADPNGRFVVTGPAGVRAAERWLLRHLIKPSEGFMSRHFERRISLGLTRHLCRTSITPNAMTLISVGLGLAGAPFFLSPEPAHQLTGALLFLAHSILDGCDGELARLKFLESPYGAVLDFWGDNLVHAAVFGCIAVGWSRATGSAWPLLLGAFVIAMTAGAAATVFGRLARGVSPESPVGRFVDALSHRDFIYVIVALATVGKAAWFLVIAAAGMPIFLLLLARAERRDRVS